MWTLHDSLRPRWTLMSVSNCSTGKYLPLFGNWGQLLFSSSQHGQFITWNNFLLCCFVGEQRLQKQTIVQAESHLVEKMRYLDQSLCPLFYRPLWHPFMDLIWFLFSFWVFSLWPQVRDNIKSNVFWWVYLSESMEEEKANGNGRGRGRERKRDQLRLKLCLYEKET